MIIGAAVGVVFGGSAAKIINSTILGNVAVAQPHAYALVKIVLYNKLLLNFATLLFFTDKSKYIFVPCKTN